VLAEGVGTLPLIMYRRRGDGGKERATNHPLAAVLHDQPNRWQTSMEWREMSMGHLTLRGNAYSEMIAGARGFVDELRPLHPDRIKVWLMKNGDLQYRHREMDNTERVIEWDRMFHLRGLSSNGLTGISVIEMAREAIGLGLATEGYGARFFSQDATPRGVLTHPGSLTTDAAKRVVASWQEARAGLENVHKTAILDEGMEWKQMGMTSEDAQFLQTREFELTDVARWFRVPPHLIGILSRATFSNIEKQSLEFVVYTLMPWLVRWEQRISADLMLEPQIFFAEFLVAGLLRGDTKERHEAYGIARQWGWLSVNDIRRLENMNPIPNGDVYLQPTNMMPAPNGQSAQLSLMAREAAGRVVRREMNALARAAKVHADDSDAWQRAVCDFYAEHIPFVATALCIDDERAGQYVASQRELVLERGVGVVEDFEQTSLSALVNLALGEEMADAAT
jgi:HK97 family phage portal protein